MNEHLLWLLFAVVGTTSGIAFGQSLRWQESAKKFIKLSPPIKLKPYTEKENP